MANPGYGGGAPAFIGSKVVRVPLADDYSHDVRAMLKADPDAGAYYICNPNNPTATITSRKDIEFLLANKNKDAVVVVDEAYIHFSDKAVSASDLVAADKDVVVLRTSRRSTAWPVSAPDSPPRAPSCFRNYARSLAAASCRLPDSRAPPPA